MESEHLSSKPKLPHLIKLSSKELISGIPHDLSCKGKIIQGIYKVDHQISKYMVLKFSSQNTINLKMLGDKIFNVFTTAYPKYENFISSLEFQEEKKGQLKSIYMILIEIEKKINEISKPCDKENIRKWIKDLIKALYRLHKKKLYHRMLFPEKIYITGYGKLFFGLFDISQLFIEKISHNKDELQFQDISSIKYNQTEDLDKRIKPVLKVLDSNLDFNHSIDIYATGLLSLYLSDHNLPISFESLSNINKTTFSEVFNHIQEFLNPTTTYPFSDIITSIFQQNPMNKKIYPSLLQLLKKYNDTIFSLHPSLSQKFLSFKDKLNLLKEHHEIDIVDDGAVLTAAITTDGKILVSGGSDGKVVFWDLENNEELFSRQTHKNGVNIIKITSDNKIAISGGKDTYVCFWDIKNHKKLSKTKAHHGYVICIAISGDNKKAITGGEDGKLKVWNLDKRRIEHELTGHDMNWREKYSVTCLDIRKDGDVAISGGADGCIRVWRVSWKCQEGVMQGHLSNMPMSSAVIPYGENEDEFLDFDGRFENATCLQITSDNQYAISGGEDGFIRIWEIMMKSQSFEKQVHRSGRLEGVRCLVLSSCNKFLISGGSDGKIVIMDYHKKNILFDSQIHTDTPIGGVTCICITKNNTYAVSGGVDCKLVIFNLLTVNIENTIEGHFNQILGLIPQGLSNFISYSSDGFIKSWDLTGKEIIALKGHTGDITALHIYSNGKKIVSGGAKGVVKFWDAKKGYWNKEIRIHKNWISCFCTNKDESILISGDGEGVIKIWNLYLKQVKKEIFICQNPIAYIVYSNDEECLFIADADDKVYVYVVKNNEIKHIKNFYYYNQWVGKYPEFCAFGDYLMN